MIYLPHLSHLRPKQKDISQTVSISISKLKYKEKKPKPMRQFNVLKSITNKKRTLLSVFA